jgi:glycosyltransferase involved in cell wall biosynthesis
MLQRELFIVPRACDALDGETLVTLWLLIKRFVEKGRTDLIKVVVRTGSIAGQYLQAAGQDVVPEVIPDWDKKYFLRNERAWVVQQPFYWPLQLGNWVERSLLSSLILAEPKLSFSGRPVYRLHHNFLALSYSALGYWSCRLGFSLLSPITFCNSNFTKHHIQLFIMDVAEVLHQPVNLEKFRPLLQWQTQAPPSLMPIPASDARMMMTLSRINLAGIVNDKNFRGLIPMLAELKQRGEFYHGVVINEDEDRSPNQSNSKVLMTKAECLNVADSFIILPSPFKIADFYHLADVGVFLAPLGAFGRLMVNAVACRVPLLCSQIGGIGNTLGHIATEWMVEINNTTVIVQAIINVVNNSQAPEYLLRGQKWVEEHFSLGNHARKILKLVKIESLSPILSASSPCINKAA